METFVIIFLGAVGITGLGVAQKAHKRINELEAEIKKLKESLGK